LVRAGEKTLAFVADEDARRLSVVDVDGGSPIAHADLAAAPGAVLVSASGRVAVTLPARSQLQILSFQSDTLKPACSIATAPEPIALAVTPDARTLLVTSAWGHALAAYDTTSLTEQFRLDLPRDPRAVVVSHDGSRAFVSHAVGGSVSVVELATRRVERTPVDAPPSLPALERIRSFREQNEARLLSAEGEVRAELQKNFDEHLKLLQAPERVANQGFSLVSLQNGNRVLIPQVQVDPGQRESRSNGYGSGALLSAAPSVAVLDAVSGRLDPYSIPAVAAWRGPDVIAPASESCLLPRAAAADEEQGTLLVTCLGTDTLTGYDAAAPSPVDAEIFRVRVAAGPTGVAVDPAKRRAVVWSQFERVLNVVPLPDTRGPLASSDPLVRRVAVGAVASAELPDEIALGRRLFHAAGDPRISRDGRACASCHVAGRDDGLVWSTPSGPRRTKALAGLLVGAAPYSWDGESANLHAQLESTIERLEGQGGLRAIERDALVAYVSSLPGPPRVLDSDAVVERGALLFASAETGCSSCHSGDQKSDGARHAVSSASDADATARFDTPSLAFVSGRAPYFHDGRYGTLRDVLTAKGDKMGRTSQLSERDLVALEAFLRTL
jgi:DNA-binding beta-propeller fold protein YncE